MSRIESVAKGGYYPTPPRVAEAIARTLVPAPTAGTRVVRLVDPCAGTGEAAAVIADALSAERFGIELNAARPEAARVDWVDGTTRNWGHLGNRRQRDEPRHAAPGPGS